MLVFTSAASTGGGVSFDSHVTKVSSSSVRCKIQAKSNDSGTHLEAVISAGGPVTGTYAFKVEPSNGGKALIDENGPFEIKADGPSEVKQASLDLPPDTGYNASLSVEWPNGSSSCSASTS